METDNHADASAGNLTTAVNPNQGLGKDYLTCMNSSKKHKREGSSLLFKMGEYVPHTKEDKEVISKAKECSMKLLKESKLGSY